MVSAKWYPVSRNSTSTPDREACLQGRTLDTALAARSTSTASCMFDAAMRPWPKVRAAQSSTASALASGPSSSAPRRARSRSSSAVYDRPGVSTSVLATVIPLPPLTCPMKEPRSRPTSPRTCAGIRRNATPRVVLPPVASPPRRSTGSRTAPRVRSLKIGLIGAGDPLGEALAGVALLGVVADHPVHVVAQLAGSHLQPAQLAAESGVQPEAATQVHLETGHLVAVRGGDDLALEPDVGGLGAGAGVRAAVEVDCDGGLQVRDVGQPALQLGDQRGGPALGLHDGQLAELDAGAGHGVSPPRRRVGVQAQLGQLSFQLVDPLVGDVQHQQLLLHRGAQPV